MPQAEITTKAGAAITGTNPPIQVVVISGFPKGHSLAADTAHRRLCVALERPVTNVAQHTIGRLAHGSVELDALVAAMGGRS